MKQEPFKLRVGNLTIRGQVFKPDQSNRPTPAVVILHGIPRNKPDPRDKGYAPMAKKLARMGFICALLSFRGCGASGGNFSILGWSEDLKSLLDWMEKEYQPSGTALLGFSGGAAVAIYTAARDKRVSAVLSASAPAFFEVLGLQKDAGSWIERFREIGLIKDSEFPESIADWVAEFDRIRPVKWVHKISPRPVLFMHGDQDETIPVGHAKMLYKKARGPKELFVIKGAPHRLRQDGAAVAKALDWLKEWKESL
jgi:uncharacterized protein